jgi:hypothetical protein
VYGSAGTKNDASTAERRLPPTSETGLTAESGKKFLQHALKKKQLPKLLLGRRHERSRVIDMIKLMERGGVIDVWKRFILGNGDVQKRAQRFPSRLDIKNQQPIRSNRLLHRRNVLSKDGLAMRAIGETIAEGTGVDDVARTLGPLVVL